MEEKKKCPYCQSEINSKAIVCPNCSRDISKTFTIISIIEATIGIALSGFLLYIGIKLILFALS